MICPATTDEEDKYMYGFFKSMLNDNLLKPSDLSSYSKKWVMAYEFKHGSELPVIKHFTDEASGD